MAKKYLLVLLIALTNFISSSIMAQPKPGRYKPTKYDSVKKVIPPQYYGNAKEAKRLDSIAKAEALQKEQEARQKAEREAQEKKILEEQMMIDKKNKKKKAPAVNYEKPENKEPAVVQPKVIKAPVVKPPIQKTNTVQPKVVKPKLAEPKSETYNKTENKPVNKYADNKRANRTNWTLEECIQYAKENNLQVAEAELNERYEQLLYAENKSRQYPDLNADINGGRSFGRNIDPVTNQFVTNNFNYAIAGLNSKTLLFGWFQKKYEIEKNKLDADAASIASSQLKDDIALNITAGFLRVLQARESKKLVVDYMSAMRKQISPEERYRLDDVSDAYYASLVAADSIRYAEAIVAERNALLELKALMNMDAKEDFDIQTTLNQSAQIASYASLSDEENLYNTALQKNNAIQYEEIKLMSAKTNLDMYKAMQYPTLSLYGNLGSVYSSNTRKIISQTYEGEGRVGYVNIDGSSYPVTSSQYNYTTQAQPFFGQLGDHLRAAIGVGINVPLVNGSSARADIQRAKIKLVGRQINLDARKQKLRQDVGRAYEEAKASSQKYIAYQRASDKNEAFFNLFNKKTLQSVSQMNEWNTQRINNVEMQLNAVQSKYDLLFKLKTIDYLTGTTLKL